jgi:hypothetical protein
MREPDHLSADWIAKDICARATIISLREDALELAAIARALEPSAHFLPPLSDDAHDRAMELLILLLLERQRGRRLLELLVPQCG